MTAACYCPAQKVLYSDSRVVASGIVVGDAARKILFHDNICGVGEGLVAYAGSETAINAVRAWFDGRTLEPPQLERNSLSAIVLDVEGNVYSVEAAAPHPTPLHPNRFFVVGSEWPITQGVWEATKDSELAMRTIIRIDTNAGGDLWRAWFSEEGVPRLAKVETDGTLIEVDIRDTQDF